MWLVRGLATVRFRTVVSCKQECRRANGKVMAEERSALDLNYESHPNKFCCYINVALWSVTPVQIRYVQEYMPIIAKVARGEWT